MRKQINTSHLAAEIIRGKWLLADAASYLPAAFALLSRAPLADVGETARPSFMLRTVLSLAMVLRRALRRRWQLFRFMAQ